MGKYTGDASGREPNAGDLRDTGSIPGSGRSPVGGHGNPLHYCCPENPIQPGELQSMGLQRVGHKQKRLSMHACY